MYEWRARTSTLALCWPSRVADVTTQSLPRRGPQYTRMPLSLLHSLIQVALSEAVTHTGLSLP